MNSAGKSLRNSVSGIPKKKRNVSIILENDEVS